MRQRFTKTKKHALSLLLCTALLCALLPQTALAATEKTISSDMTVTYGGSGSGETTWENLWKDGSDTVTTLTVAQGSTLTVDVNSTSLNSITVPSGSTLIVNGTLKITGEGSVVNSRYLQVLGTLENSGTIEIASSSVLMIGSQSTTETSSGTFTNNGTVIVGDSTNGGSFNLILRDNTTLTNNSTINIYGMINAYYATIINAADATINVDNKTGLNTENLSVWGSTLTNSGTINIASGATVEIAPGASTATLNNTGTITNNGTLELYAYTSGSEKKTTTLNNSGSLTNNSGATLDIKGDLKNANGATITNAGTIELNSTLAGTLENNGSLTNNGTISGNSSGLTGSGTVTGTGVTFSKDATKWTITLGAALVSETASAQLSGAELPTYDSPGSGVNSIDVTDITASSSGLINVVYGKNYQGNYCIVSFNNDGTYKWYNIFAEITLTNLISGGGCYLGTLTAPAAMKQSRDEVLDAATDFTTTLTNETVTLLDSDAYQENLGETVYYGKAYKIELGAGDTLTMSASYLDDSEAALQLYSKSGSSFASLAYNPTNYTASQAGTVYLMAYGIYTGNISLSVSKASASSGTTPSVKISVTPASLSFESRTAGYTEAPAAQTVTVTNTGSGKVYVSIPYSSEYDTAGGTGFSNGMAELEAADSTSDTQAGTASFSVQPKIGLPAGSYSETLVIEAGDNSQTTYTTVSVSLSFTVNATASPADVSYDKATATGGIDITLNVGSSTYDYGDITVKNGSSTLTSDTDYTRSENVFTISQNYLNSLSAGSHTLTFDGFAGTAPSVIITVSDSRTYAVSVSPASLSFDSVTEGYTAAPAAQTVTITNTGNQSMNVTLPTSGNYTITAGSGFTGSSATLAANGTAAFTVQPKTGLAAGSYSETLTVAAASGAKTASANITLSFTVNSKSTPGGDSGGSASGGGTSGGTNNGTSGGTTYTPTVENTEGGDVAIDTTDPKAGDTVTVTPAPESGKEVEKITVTDENGNEIPVTDNGDGTWSFTQPSGKVTVNVSFEDAASSVGFTDVPADAYYYDAVLWAVENGITTGTSDTTFSPNANCTRAQAITFIWRAAGSPEPAGTDNPFDDVSADAYYYKAVLWAVENSVTAGATETSFAPDAVCTREQIVTFMYRAAGSPAPETDGDSAFTDVQPGAYYYNAVLWAVKNGVTTGTSADTFSPNADCTRAQIVTFLYRNAK